MTKNRPPVSSSRTKSPTGSETSKRAKAPDLRQNRRRPDPAGRTPPTHPVSDQDSRPKGDETDPPVHAPRAFVKETGELFYGLNTCLALWEKQAEGIKRLFVSEDRLKKVGKILKWCAQRKRPYHVVTPHDLEKITKSVHHEGLALLMEPQFPMIEEDFFHWLETQGDVRSHQGTPLMLIYLDGLKNPHNLGSVVRTAAHFGTPVILGRMGELPRMSPSAARIAEGGMLAVRCVALKDPLLALDRLRKDFAFELVGTQSALSQGPGTQGGASLEKPPSGRDQGPWGSLYEKPFARKTLLILGNEVQGMSKDLRHLADRHVFIPGSGHIESLNVAVAAGIFLGEFWRLYGQKKHPSS